MTGTSPALLPKWLSNFKAMQWFKLPMPITALLLGDVGFPSWEAPGLVHSFTISPSRNLRSGPTSVQIAGNRQQWLILIGVESQSSLQQSKTEKRLWRGSNFIVYIEFRMSWRVIWNVNCDKQPRIDRDIKFTWLKRHAAGQVPPCALIQFPQFGNACRWNMWGSLKYPSQVADNFRYL